MDDEGQLIGVISEFDILKLYRKDPNSIYSITTKQIRTVPVVCVSQDDRKEEVVDL